MKKFFLCMMCLFALCGYAQEDEDDLIGGKRYNEWLANLTCTEVCGVRFGSQYETAKEVLQNKFGSPDYTLTDENQIVYNYKTYGGIAFSTIVFAFQRNNNNSYMNQCVMLIDCKTAQEVKEKRDYIFSKVIEKYGTWNEYIDKNGFKYYQSGISPLGGEIGSGFDIDVMKYNKPYNGYNYFARIIYGPYNYIHEEF